MTDGRGWRTRKRDKLAYPRPAMLFILFLQSQSSGSSQLLSNTARFLLLFFPRLYSCHPSIRSPTLTFFCSLSLSLSPSLPPCVRCFLSSLFLNALLGHSLCAAVCGVTGVNQGDNPWDFQGFKMFVLANINYNSSKKHKQSGSAE